MTSRDMVFQDGPIEGVVLRPLDRYSDPRGWLVELFRADELSVEFVPVMSYVSQTEPGVARGPHEHREQADYFAFFGPGDFALYLWDARREAASFGRRQRMVVGQSNPQCVIVPPGVVHAYKNVSDIAGLVFNAPNRLYRGPGKKEAVDEIRHEDVPNTPYLID